MLSGDLTLAIADVDLVHVSLRAVITAIRPETPHLGGASPHMNRDLPDFEQMDE